MAKTWGDAKSFIARTNGGEGSSDNLALAGDALSSVLGRYSGYHEWSWLETEEQLSIVAGTSDYATTSNIRAPYTLKLLTSGVTLLYKTQREIDRIYDPQDTGTSVCYTVYRAASFDPQLGMTTRLRLYPTPTATETALHKYARAITLEGTDTAYVDVRDDILGDVLQYARGEYLLLKDAETYRAQVLLKRGEDRLKQHRSWDLRGPSDRDVTLVPFDLWSGGSAASSDAAGAGTGSTDLIQGESLVPDSGA